MNLRVPQAFIGVDVSHAPENALIEKQRLDPRVTSLERGAELLFGDFERVETQGAQRAENAGGGALREDSDASEAANVAVAHFAAVVESEVGVRVRGDGRLGLAGDKLACHAQMNQEQELFRIAAAGVEVE